MIKQDYVLLKKEDYNKLTSTYNKKRKRKKKLHRILTALSPVGEVIQEVSVLVLFVLVGYFSCILLFSFFPQ